MAVTPRMFDNWVQAKKAVDYRKANPKKGIGFSKNSALKDALRDALGNASFEAISDTMIMFSTELGKRIFPEEAAENKKAAAVHAAAEFAIAGFASLENDKNKKRNGGYFRNDDEAGPDCGCSTSDAVHCITCGTERLADLLAPEGLNGNDKFVFGIDVLQDIVECAAPVVD